MFDRVDRQLNVLEARNIYPYKVRNETKGVWRRVPQAEVRLDLAERSWFWAAPKLYSNLPTDLKTEIKIQKFRMGLKNWVSSNVAL